MSNEEKQHRFATRSDLTAEQAESKERVANAQGGEFVKITLMTGTDANQQPPHLSCPDDPLDVALAKALRPPSLSKDFDDRLKAALDAERTRSTITAEIEAQALVWSREIGAGPLANERWQEYKRWFNACKEHRIAFLRAYAGAKESS